jgi:O-antigen/teichoic acid export membrane protein
MKFDIITNYVTQLINIFLRFFLIPIYISRLGISSYGIIGFYFSIESILVLADFGIGLTSNKFLAQKFRIEPKETIEVIRSVELLYLTISLLIGIFVYISSNWIAHKWLIIDESLNPTYVIKLMAILLAISWPKSLYENFLIGLGKNTQKNIISILFIILRSIVMIFSFNFFSSTIEVYFFVMIITLLCEILIMRTFVFLSFKNIFVTTNFSGLIPFLKTASGVGVFSLLSLLLFQTDKIVISKLLNISELGVYSVTSIIPLAMLSLIYPIVSASFPRLVNINVDKDAIKVFNNSSFLLALICSAYFLFVYTNFEFIGRIWLKEDFNKIDLITAYYILGGIFLHSFTNLTTNLFIANNKSSVVVLNYTIAILFYLIFIGISEEITLRKISTGWLLCNFILLTSYLISLFKIYKQISFDLISTFLLFLTCILLFLLTYHQVLFDINTTKTLKLIINSVCILLFLITISARRIFNYLKLY